MAKQRLVAVMALTFRDGGRYRFTDKVRWLGPHHGVDVPGRGLEVYPNIRE